MDWMRWKFIKEDEKEKNQARLGLDCLMLEYRPPKQEDLRLAKLQRIFYLVREQIPRYDQGNCIVMVQ